MKVIIYPENGTVSVCFPNPDLDINWVAQKDVPTGVKYKIVNQSDLPDVTFHSAWEYDFNADNDGVGA
mgnify:CR=1 FL=1|tara:strand:+ start:872 stop:1075 length:204 start_codon:yes stop_codon:yes gene_type:complete